MSETIAPQAPATVSAQHSAIPDSPSSAPMVIGVSPRNAPAQSIQQASRSDNLGHGDPGGNVGGISQSQHRDLIQHAVNIGQLEIGAANKMLADEGIAPLSSGADQLSPEALYDRNFSAPSSPEGYSNIPYLQPHGVAPTAETNAIDVGFRKAAHAAGLNNQLAQSAAEVIRQTNAEMLRMNNDVDQQQAWFSRQDQALRAAWGVDTDRNIAAVGKYLTDVIEPKAPGTIAMLKGSLAIGNASLIKMLHDQAVRSNFRHGGKL